MIISKKEILDFYGQCFDEHSEASEITKGVTANMKTFAEDKELNLKALKAAYTVFSKYKKGNIPEDDYDEIMTIVEDSFGV